jgi:hypothetical protein
MTNEQLAALSEAALPGDLDARGWGVGSTLYGMTNVFNDDAEVLVMECIPEADAKFIVALWNAYRVNQIAVIGPDAVERVARAIWEVQCERWGKYREQVPELCAWEDLSLSKQWELMAEATAAIAALKGEAA